MVSVNHLTALGHLPASVSCRSKKKKLWLHVVLDWRGVEDCTWVVWLLFKVWCISMLSPWFFNIFTKLIGYLWWFISLREKYLPSEVWRRLFLKTQMSVRIVLHVKFSKKHVFPNPKIFMIEKMGYSKTHQKWFHTILPDLKNKKHFRDWICSVNRSEIRCVNVFYIFLLNHSHATPIE